MHRFENILNGDPILLRFEIHILQRNLDLLRALDANLGDRIIQLRCPPLTLGLNCPRYRISRWLRN